MDRFLVVIRVDMEINALIGNDGNLLTKGATV